MQPHDYKVEATLRAFNGRYSHLSFTLRATSIKQVEDALMDMAKDSYETVVKYTIKDEVTNSMTMGPRTGKEVIRITDESSPPVPMWYDHEAFSDKTVEALEVTEYDSLA